MKHWIKVHYQSLLYTLACYGALSAVLGVLYYDSLWFMVFGSPLSVLVYRLVCEWEQRRRKRQIEEEFKEFMTSMSAALNAGYALENTFAMIVADLRRAFPNKEPLLCVECEQCIHKLEMKQPVEQVLMELAAHTKVPEIEDFSCVIGIAKKSGGNLIQIIQNTAVQMKETMQVQQEIQVVVAAKALEQNIMLLVPLGMILYLRIFNQGYLDVLYGNAAGIVVMTGCLLVEVTAYMMSRRILQIVV
jgi:tight adherence protein B